MKHLENFNAGKNLSYLLIGCGIGATLALLFAPKSGGELRDDISSSANKGLELTKDTVGKLRKNASDYYDTAHEKTGDYYEIAKDKANDVYNKIAAKAENIAETVEELPENAQSLLSEKVEQINSAVEAGQKEYKRKAQNV
jgi:gas vesicle protein